MASKKRPTKQKADLDKIFESDPKLVDLIGRQFATQAGLRLLRERSSEFANKSDNEVRKEIYVHLRELSESEEFEIQIVIDHRNSLLKEARARLRANDFDLAAVFFATYYEHQVNRIIIDICERNDFSESIAKKIIRETNLNAKCTWVFQLIGFKPLKKLWLSRLKEISDLRNAYLHYKWRPEPDELPGKRKSEYAQTLKHAEGIVRYLRRYEDSELHSGQGHRIKQIFKKRKSS